MREKIFFPTSDSGITSYLYGRKLTLTTYLMPYVKSPRNEW